MNKKFVYLLKTPENIYKIGVTKDINKRIKSLQTGCADQIILVDKFLSNYPFKIESTLHRRYSENRVNGEWFYMSDDDIKSFQESCELLEKNFKCLDDMNNPYFQS